MAVKKNRLNKFFAGLIIILLLGMIGISIYFQVIIGGLDDENEFLADQLKLTSEELFDTMSQLEQANTTARNLNTNLESYTNEFQEVYQICEGENSDLSNDLISTKSQLSKSQNKVIGLEANIENIKKTLINIKLIFVSINDGFEDLDSDISGINKRSNNIEDYLDDISNSALLTDAKDYGDDAEDENIELKDKISDARSSSDDVQEIIIELEGAIDTSIASISN